MSERYDKAYSFLDEAVSEASPHQNPELIAESVWKALQESVAGGWRTQEEADRLAHRWLGKWAARDNPDTRD